MNIRWPLVASVVALFAGAGLAALVLALCSEGAEGPGELEARATARAAATRTAIARTRTPRAEILAATETAEESTPVPDEPEPPPVEEEPPPQEEPPPEEEPPVPEETPTPEPPTPTATPIGPEATPTPVPLPDLTVLVVGVFRDQILVVASNVGEGPLPADSQVDISVRGIVADSVILDEPLLPGDSFTRVLSDQVIYRPEVVPAQVDPYNLIPEENEDNNAKTEPLEPDITPDLGLTGLAAVGGKRYLAVDVANTTRAPIRQAAVTFYAFPCGSTAPIATMDTTIDLDPLGSVRIEILPDPDLTVAPGVCMQVRMEVLDIPDADLANNVFEGMVP